MEERCKLNKTKLAYFFLGALLIFYPFRKHEDLILRFDIIGLVFFLIGTLFIFRKEAGQLLTSRPYKYFAIFILWTGLVNIYYCYEFSNNRFLLNTCLYTGLFLFTLSINLLINLDSKLFIKNTFLFFLISLLIQVIFIIVFDNRLRAHGVFQNPNQLGRFAIFILTLISFYRKKSNYPKDNSFIIAIAMCTFLIVVSLSRAAIIAFVVLMFINLFIWRSTIIKGILIGFGILFFYSNINNQPIFGKLDSINSRFLDENNPDDQIKNRGYTRILDYPEYLVFGAGEQAQDRFNKEKLEFHSTYGNILFSYGIVGFILFTFFYTFCFFPLVIEIMFFLPFLTHSLVHNDIRNIYLWIFTAFFISIKYCGNNNLSLTRF